MMIQDLVSHCPRFSLFSCRNFSLRPYWLVRWKQQSALPPSCKVSFQSSLVAVFCLFVFLVSFLSSGSYKSSEIYWTRISITKLGHVSFLNESLWWEASNFLFGLAYVTYPPLHVEVGPCPNLRMERAHLFPNFSDAARPALKTVVAKD